MATLTYGQNSLTADFSAGAGKDLETTRYEGAARYPFNMNSPGLSLYGNGAGCNTVTGSFTVLELAINPQQVLERFSAVFEQHCEGSTPALRGIIHYNANGKPDPVIAATRTITLPGKIVRLTYDADSHTAYGLDATNRRITRIDIGAGTTKSVDVVQVPNDACVDSMRKRLFVVNKSSSIISEYQIDSLAAMRDISWTPMDSSPPDTHFHIYCAKDKLYAIDGAWAPALFTVENLDADKPTVTDRTTTVSGVGALVLNAAQSNLYFWRQYGWGAGDLNTYVRRLQTSDLSTVDETMVSFSEGFLRDPVDAPVLLDETRNLVFAKNMVFDAFNLSKRVYTLPGKIDTNAGASENTYAVAPKAGLIASHNFVYELGRYEIVTRTLTKSADQMFFDRDGLLWFLSTSKGVLEAQKIEH